MAKKKLEAEKIELIVAIENLLIDSIDFVEVLEFLPIKELKNLHLQLTAAFKTLKKVKHSLTLKQLETKLLNGFFYLETIKKKLTNDIARKIKAINKGEKNG